MRVWGLPCGDRTEERSGFRIKWNYIPIGNFRDFSENSVELSKNSALKDNDESTGISVEKWRDFYCFLRIPRKLFQTDG